MRKNFSLLVLFLLGAGALVGCNSAPEAEALPKVQAAAKQQPGANTPPAMANGITASQVKAAKNGD